MRRILFEKTGKAAWISHLDTIRLMQRAFRRAGVLLHHSQGFTPHAYVSLPLPLSVGVESLCEILEYELDSEMELSPEGLNEVMPEGIRVRQVYESPVKAKHITYLQAVLCLEYDGGVPDGAQKAIEELLKEQTLPVEKRSKRGIEEIDILPMLRSWELKPQAQCLHLYCTVCAQNPTLNPMLLAEAVSRHLPRYRADHVRCRRLELLDAEGKVFR